MLAEPPHCSGGREPQGVDLPDCAERRTRHAQHRLAPPLQAVEESRCSLGGKNPGPEADAARREQLALVRRALRALRPEEQEVFLLRQNGQMTYDQIAQAIEIPVGTVKTRMRLALTKLREALEVK